MQNEINTAFYKEKTDLYGRFFPKRGIYHEKQGILTISLSKYILTYDCVFSVKKCC